MYVATPTETDTDAETMALSALLGHPERGEWWEAVDDGLFHGRERIIFCAMRRLWDDGRPVDLVTVPPEVAAHGIRASDIAELTETFITHVNFPEVVARLERARNRRIVRCEREQLGQLEREGDPRRFDEGLALWAVSRSRPLSTREGKESPIRISDLEEPPPRREVVGGAIPEGATTILYGDGGQGKSLVALHLATCTVAGLPWLGLPVIKGPVLYVDAELDVEEFTRRAYRVARGLGLDRPPAGLLYKRLDASLLDRTVPERVRRMARHAETVLTVMDSLTIGCSGGDLREAPVVTAVLKDLEKWGTVLAIDHPPAPQAGVPKSAYRPFGSTFKFNLCRSSLQLVRAPGGGLVLHCKKRSFGPETPPRGLALTFTKDVVTLESVPLEDDRLSGSEDDLAPVDRVDRALRQHPSGVTPDDLATALGNMTEKTVRNHLTTLKAQKRATNDAGRWQPVPSLPVGIGIGNRESLGRPESASAWGEV
jgi:hypothetical protein